MRKISRLVVSRTTTIAGEEDVFPLVVLVAYNLLSSFSRGGNRTGECFLAEGGRRENQSIPGEAWGENPSPREPSQPTGGADSAA